MTIKVFRLHKLRTIDWHVAAFWTCLVSTLVLALVPSLGTVSMPTTGWDKGNHALAFGVLTILGCIAYPFRKNRVILCVFCYGGLIEVLQWFTPYRQADWLDLTADTVGIVAGYTFERLRLLVVSTDRVSHGI